MLFTEGSGFNLKLEYSCFDMKLEMTIKAYCIGDNIGVNKF